MPVVEFRRSRTKKEHRPAARRKPACRRRPRRWLWLAGGLMLAWMALTLLSVASHRGQAMLAGEPTHIVGGDTFDLGGERIRVHGIDAPEMATNDGAAARDGLVGISPGGSSPAVTRESARMAELWLPAAQARGKI